MALAPGSVVAIEPVDSPRLVRPGGGGDLRYEVEPLDTSARIVVQSTWHQRQARNPNLIWPEHQDSPREPSGPDALVDDVRTFFRRLRGSR